VYRGGHFASPLSDALASSRKWTLPDKTQEFLGFRVAATPAQP
jgi:serine/threonine-protein kinase